MVLPCHVGCSKRHRLGDSSGEPLLCPSMGGQGKRQTQRHRQQEKITGQLPYGTRRGRLRMPAAISAHEDFIRPRDGSRHPDIASGTELYHNHLDSEKAVCLTIRVYDFVLCVDLGLSFVRRLYKRKSLHDGCKVRNGTVIFRWKDKHKEKVSALLTQLNWTNHLLILSGSKSVEEREFYICLAAKERYSSRQLERQMDSGYYERYMLSKDRPLPESVHTKQNPFLDSYIMEFLDLPDTFHENDFRRGLVLCASKNDEVVEYAMSRTLSPMMVSRYQLQLPDKDVLRRKLKNLTLSMGGAGI